MQGSRAGAGAFVWRWRHSTKKPRSGYVRSAAGLGGSVGLCINKWIGKRDSNSRPSVREANTPFARLSGGFFQGFFNFFEVGKLVGVFVYFGVDYFAFFVDDEGRAFADAFEAH